MKKSKWGTKHRWTKAYEDKFFRHIDLIQAKERARRKRAAEKKRLAKNRKARAARRSGRVRKSLNSYFR